jgi:hypothetical protein
LDQFEEYLIRASAARKYAETAVDATLKESFLKIAEEYERMAARVSPPAK